MAISPGYFVGEALQSFRKNWVMSLVAVTIIYISLLLVGAFFLTGALLNRVVTSFEAKVSINIFLKDGAADADLTALQDAIRKDARVEGVTYVSKDEALKRFKERTKNTPQLVEQLRGNPLPASLEIKLKDPRQVKEVVGYIKTIPALANCIKNPKDPEAEDIRYGQNIVENLFAATAAVRMFVLVFVIMLLVVSLVLIGNTIRLAIYSRRKEIGIMRLVGASNWFIRTPFLFEGVLQAIIGAVLAILTLMAAQALIVPWLQNNLRFLPVAVESSTIAQLMGLLMLTGILIGLVGSGAAVRKYLKV
ncbi:MAG TPA: permease-like cell division protein FtsX [Coriobacteriia bacterium]